MMVPLGSSPAYLRPGHRSGPLRKRCWTPPVPRSSIPQRDTLRGQPVERKIFTRFSCQNVQVIRAIDILTRRFLVLKRPKCRTRHTREKFFVFSPDPTRKPDRGSVYSCDDFVSRKFRRWKRTDPPRKPKQRSAVACANARREACRSATRTASARCATRAGAGGSRRPPRPPLPRRMYTRRPLPRLPAPMTTR